MDNHNAMWNGSEKKQQVVLDNVWITHIWEIRVFLFYSMHRGKFIFVSHVFSKKGGIFQGFYIEISL